MGPANPDGVQWYIGLVGGKALLLAGTNGISRLHAASGNDPAKFHFAKAD